MTPSRTTLVLLTLLLAVAARAQAHNCADGVRAQRPGKFCDTVEGCITFCGCACTFDPHKWKADVKDDDSTTCPNMPETGTGMLPPNSPDLVDISTLAYMSVPRGAKATRAAFEGLQRLSAHLAASENRRRLNYTVRVGSCYRRHLEDSVPECGYVLKGAYMLARTSDPAQRERWTTAANPMNLGLTWPGRTPHSGGYGCDLILVDSHGTDSFDWRAGVAGSQSSTIAQKLASALMDDEATNPEVGAKRLTYEAWHYEWGPNASGCRAPECASRYWPPTGKP